MSKGNAALPCRREEGWGLPEVVRLPSMSHILGNQRNRTSVPPYCDGSGMWVMCKLAYVCGTAVKFAGLSPAIQRQISISFC